MNSKLIILGGLGSFVLLLAAALIILLQPPKSTAGIATSLKASNPALGIRYSYDPAVFQPAPYDPTAEFPMRVNSGEWSLYGKRIAGVADLLQREAAPVLYGFITETSSSEYITFYGLEQVGSASYDETQLAGQRVLRQQLKLRLGSRTASWPAFFPTSITAGVTAQLMPRSAEAEEVFRLPGYIPPVAEDGLSTVPASSAWLYGWAVFAGNDLYLFQAIAPRELSADELSVAEVLLNAIEYNALL